jgi:8-oxo-dGTP diphosphatase
VEIRPSSDKPRKLVTVICACIRRSGGQEVLLSVRRAPGVSGLDGKWELPGGKIEFGETPELTIVREISEEIGIDVAPVRLLPYLHTNLWEYEHASQQVTLACFECHVIGQESPRLGDDARWFRLEDINFGSTLPGTQEFISLAFRNEPLEEVYLRFEYVDPGSNRFRQFSVATQPTLYSKYGLVKYWGRIGQWSRLLAEEFASPKELDTALLDIAKRRIAHGYRIVDAQGSTARYRVLQDILGLARSHGAIQPPDAATFLRSDSAKPAGTETGAKTFEVTIESLEPNDAQQLELRFESSTPPPEEDPPRTHGVT